MSYYFIDKETIDLTDIIFLSLKNDAVKLYEVESIDKVMNYFWDKGVKIIIVKSHIDNGYYTGYNGNITFTEFYNTQKAISYIKKTFQQELADKHYFRKHGAGAYYGQEKK